MRAIRPSLLILAVLLALAAAGRASAAVLRVCNTSACPNGVAGTYTTIQAAVNAAGPGDWILLAPGIYHESGSPQAGVYITTPNIHIRGLNRNTVIVDGTSAAQGAPPCPADASLQNITSDGRNGVEVFKTDSVSLENLTVCNFLGSDGGARGNEIWWNGGDGSGQTGLGPYQGAYLTATSTYFKDSNSAQAQYGIFASNSHGPGSISNSYANNMGDSAFYVGACPDCNAILDHVHAQHSSLGYSGTNAGGHLIIRNSEWDDNKNGIAPNSLNNDDAPSPQSGLCPNEEIGPTGTRSCTIIENNYVHDNNNANVPAFGISGSAPVGTGIELSGGQFDTVVNNTVTNHGSWGIVINDYPDTETPPPVANCNGGISGGPTNLCYFQAKRNEIAANVFSGNGFFGNPSNGDLANAATGLGNCFHGNQDSAGLTSDPPLIEAVDFECNGPTPGGDPVLVAELICASQIFGPCPDTPLTHYPRTTTVTMIPISQTLTQPTMPNPCAGVPLNPWC